ncbi:Putative aliphatic sulfonates transport permease protein ssuC [Raoultella planticola]|uniref:Aliphatic sulfonates transport permease protein ssuC n=2 Tax=Klebsiella/Raoultella group TaxID=2890311 RepID=A0A485A6J6_RAOPL|nr:Putative aliphatic sulfonates transport permease protein ssuC [Raoultella planticola]
MATSAQKLLLRVAPWLLPVGTVIIWQLASSVGWLSTRILPSPEGVLKAFWTLSASGELWQHLAISSWRALLGFAIGGSIGLVLGLISGLSRWGERLLDTSIQMLRNVPHLALIPLVILWFGIDESAKIFLVALGTMFPIYINTWHGIRNIDRGLVEMARSYGLSGFALFRHVILPGALPSIMVGIRFALGLMWLTLIVAETISANAGIGYLAMNAREFLQTDVVGGRHYSVCHSWQTGRLQRAAAGTRLATLEPGLSSSGGQRMTTARLNPGIPLLLNGVTKRYGENTILNALDLHIPTGQFVRGGRAQRRRQKYPAASAGRARKTQRWRAAGRLNAAGTGPGRQSHDVPGLAAAAVEIGDRQRRSWIEGPMA